MYMHDYYLSRARVIINSKVYILKHPLDGNIGLVSKHEFLPVYMLLLAPLILSVKLEKLYIEILEPLWLFVRRYIADAT